MSNSIKFIYIFRGYIQVKDQLRIVRFDSWERCINPNHYYTCVDLLNYNVYDVLGGNIINYKLYNMRPLTNHDPEYIDPTLQTVWLHRQNKKGGI